MTTQPIIESGMIFGSYSEGHCFHIEKSETYQYIQKGVKIAELLLLHRSNVPKVLIIEAKSSSPRPETQPNFDEFIKEIRDKLTNALTLYVTTCLKRHSTWQELPTPFQEIDLERIDFCLILVIKGHKKDWLPPLQDELKKVLDSTVKTWKLSPTSVAVINHEVAQEQKLISGVCDEAESHS